MIQQDLFMYDGHAVRIPMKFNAPRDAHSRVWKYVAYATALGVSVSQAKNFFFLFLFHG